MCAEGRTRSRDVSACDRIKREYCDNPVDLRRNRDLCEDLGFIPPDAVSLGGTRLSEHILDEIEDIIEGIENGPNKNAQVSEHPPGR